MKKISVVIFMSLIFQMVCLSVNLFNDGFESGDFSAWDSYVDDGGDLLVTGAALHGNYGLSCFIDDTTLIYVQDDTPAEETRYRARFYIDTNNISMPNISNVHPLRVVSTFSTVSKVQLFYSTVGGYQIAIVARDDTLGDVVSDYYQISDDTHCIEVDWVAASGPGADDGWASLWIDGTFKETLSDLDNDGRAISYIQLGATISITSGISGTFLLDDFASNDDGSEIGLISCDLFDDGFESEDLTG